MVKEIVKNHHFLITSLVKLKFVIIDHSWLRFTHDVSFFHSSLHVVDLKILTFLDSSVQSFEAITSINFCNQFSKWHIKQD